jgi:hypothetical protein
MDVEILRAKYGAVTRLIAYCEESADWIEIRTQLVLARAEPPDPFDRIDQVTEMMLQTRVPGPSGELVKDELRAAVEAHPELSSVHHRTVRTAEELNTVAEDLVRLVQRSPRRQRHHLIAFLQAYAAVVVLELRTKAALAMVARDKLTRELEACAAVRWSDLTQQEQRIVKALLPGPLTGEELSRAVDRMYSGHFKTVLSGLVKRKILANDRTGYHVIVALRGE